MTSVRPKGASAEDTRERLIAAAAKLFAAQGFEGTSVKELADAAGVNVSLISYHFGGKENLFRNCLEQFGKQRLALAERVLHPPQSFEEFKLRLSMFIEEMFVVHAEDSDRSCILHRDSDMLMPIAQDVFRNTFMKVFETFVSFMVAGSKAGFLREDLDPLFMTSTIFGSMVHYMRTDKISEKFFGRSLKDPQYRNQLVEHLIQHNLYGLIAGASAGPELKS